MNERRLAAFASLAVAALMAAPGNAWAPQAPEDAAPPAPAAEPAPAAARSPARQLSAADLECLALNVYWESRGQPLAGQAAVAHVTLNRVDAPGFPATVCKVVYQGCQFGWTCNGRPKNVTDTAAWKEAQAVARRAAAGEPDPTGGALYFHHVEERPAWARGRYGQRIVIGQHVFFNVADKDTQVAETP